MERVPEPELMDDPAQAAAYAAADFAAPHQMFVERFGETFPGIEVTGCVLDLGCGPGDISLRFARAWPHCTLHGIDGAANMLRLAEQASARERLSSRLRFIHSRLPCTALPDAPPGGYAVVISNSLLHHLDDPQVLWTSIKRFAAAGAPVFIMDLLRPETPAAVDALVAAYAAGEPAVLREDFRNSLFAAYRIDEVRAQLDVAGLDLTVEQISDRHWIARGRR